MGKPFAFFGHSMGGLIAFELARRLRGRNLPEPRILFVSACGAPQIPDPHPFMHSLPDSELLQSLKKLNGIPAEVLQHSEMMQLLIPMIRADFEAFETYRFKQGDSLLGCSIVAFGGTEDLRVSRERLEGWAIQTNSRFEITYLPGDHFFVNSAKESILQVVAERIGASFAVNRPSI
jgi:medium-chain acyl-[acyl-carrier-protein] hydrolase